MPVPFDLSLFLEELEQLRNNDHAATWRRRTEVLFALLAHLPENGPREFEEYRAHLETELATTIGRMSQANLLGSTDQAEMPLSRAEALFKSAGATFERLSLWTARAAAAQNHANLLIAAHDAGDAGAAARAQDLLDAAIAIRRGANLPLELANSLQCLAGLLTARHDGDSAPPVDRAMALLDEAIGIFEREGKPYDVACAWLNQANALRCLFRSGVQAAAEQAHVLYRRALAWFRENQFWAEAATTANNQAALLRFEYERGDNAAAVLAHPLYVEARTIRRDLGHGLDAARTALNQAQLQLRECEAGDTAAGVRATPLLDHALEEFRRHGRLVEVAQTLETRALLIQFVQAETIDRIAAQAHPLLDEALRVYRHYDRRVDIARVAQNKANLLRSEFEAGAAGAAAHAHALFAEALVLRRRTGQGIDVAGTAQNQAGLYLRQYEDGNVAAAAEAETLFREAIGIFRARKLWVDLAKTEQNLAALLMKRPDPAMSEAERLLDDAMGKATFDLLPVVNLLIRRTRLAMLELQGRSDAVVTAVSDMLSDVSHQLSAIADPRARRRLLREVANLGQRGAEAALASGDSARALAVMEAGRTFELGARLREAEAALDPVSRAALDRGRTELQAAQAAYDRAPRPLDGQPVAHPFDSDERAAAAAELLRAQNASFAVLRVRLGLDVGFQVPDPDALRDALGPTAALAVPWIGKHSGGFLLLTPAVRDWRHFRLDGLTHATIDPILEQWFAGYARFADDTERSEPFPAIRRFEKGHRDGRRGHGREPPDPATRSLASAWNARRRGRRNGERSGVVRRPQTVGAAARRRATPDDGHAVSQRLRGSARAEPASLRDLHGARPARRTSHAAGYHRSAGRSSDGGQSGGGLLRPERGRGIDGISGRCAKPACRDAGHGACERRSAAARVFQLLWPRRLGFRPIRTAARSISPRRLISPLSQPTPLRSDRRPCARSNSPRAAWPCWRVAKPALSTSTAIRTNSSACRRR